MKLSVDTNGYRAFVDGDPIFVDAVQKAEIIAFSVIVLGELRARFRHGARTVHNEQVLLRVLASDRVEIHEVRAETPGVCARVWDDLRKKGLPMPTNDLWIAAQCLERGFCLLTRDGHFAAIPDLQVFPA
jgi:predicted nucleic acid-binding protein